MPYLDRDGVERLLPELFPYITDAKIPVMFCDFDGVLNQLPFQMEWIGEDTLVRNYINLADEENWQTVEISGDPDKHFVWDKLVTAQMNEKTFHIRFSTELMSNINRLVSEGKMHFVWLTTWMEYTKPLNPIVGLPDDTPFLPWQTLDRFGLPVNSQYGKYIYLRDLLREIDEEKRPPVIWLDDEVTIDFVKVNRHGEKGFPHARFKKEFGVKSLIMDIDPLYGVDRAEWNRIENFVEKNQPTQNSDTPSE